MPWWKQTKRLDRKTWSRSRTSGIKLILFFSRSTKKVLSTFIEQIPMLSLLVGSTDSRQQRQERIRSVKPRTWSGIRWSSSLSVVYKALEAPPRPLLAGSPSTAAAAAGRPSQTPMASDTPWNTPGRSTHQRVVASVVIPMTRVITTILTEIYPLCQLPQQTRRPQ